MFTTLRAVHGSSWNCFDDVYSHTWLFSKVRNIVMCCMTMLDFLEKNLFAEFSLCTILASPQVHGAKLYSKTVFHIDPNLTLPVKLRTILLSTSKLLTKLVLLN